MLTDDIDKLKLRHNFLSKRVAKMERERETYWLEGTKKRII